MLDISKWRLFQVYLSTRRGAWVINRIADNGYPLDILARRRVWELRKNIMGASLLNRLAEHNLNKRFNHADYGIKPKHGPFAQHGTVNDELPNRIACGAIIVKPDIKRLTTNGVEFVDGTVEEVDAFISATGYVFGFPYIKHPELEVKKNRVDLYKYMFPPSIKPSTLAVIGFIQPLGAIMPIAELQCRWATRVFKVCQNSHFNGFDSSRSRLWHSLYANLCFCCLLFWK